MFVEITLRDDDDIFEVVVFLVPLEDVILALPRVVVISAVLAVRVGDELLDCATFPARNSETMLEIVRFVKPNSGSVKVGWNRVGMV